MKTAVHAEPQAREVSDQEWLEMLESLTRQYFNMPLVEFKRRLERGEFGDLDGHPDLLRIAMLIPGGRQQP
jgi:hypothetical protein